MSSCYHQKDCYTYYRLTSFQRSREKRFAFRCVPLSFSLYVLPVDVFLKSVFKIFAAFFRSRYCSTGIRGKAKAQNMLEFLSEKAEGK